MEENEFKALVTIQQYEQLLGVLSRYGNLHKTVQINYYYDTADLMLYQTGNTLRARQKDGKLLLQHKHGKQISENLVTSMEYEQPIAELPRRIFAKSFPNPYGEDAVFSLIGCLVTVRADFSILNAIVSLDENYYLGASDYELEIETQDAESVENVLRIIGSNLVFSAVGKYKRFISAYIETQDNVL